MDVFGDFDDVDWPGYNVYDEYNRSDQFDEFDDSDEFEDHSSSLGLLGNYRRCCPTGKWEITDKVRRLLFYNKELFNVADEDGMTLIMVVAQERDTELAMVLLENGGKIDQKDPRGNTALQYAITAGFPVMIETLLKYNPSMFKINENGDSALMSAWRKYRDIRQDIIHFDTVEMRQRHADYRKILDLLMIHLSSSDDQKLPSYLKFCQAIIDDDIGEVRRQLSEIEDINFSHVKAEIPLAFVIVSDQLKIAEILLESGSSLEPNENLDRPSLLINFFRSGTRREKMWELLLKFAATEKTDILMLVCKYERWEYVRLLLKKYPVDVNYRGESQKTAFQIACQNADVETLELMVKLGANLLEKTELGETVLHLAAKNFQPESLSSIVDFVVHRGLMDVNVKDAEGRTPLENASNDYENLLCLLKMGADVIVDSNSIYNQEFIHTGDGDDSMTEYMDKRMVSDYLQRLKFLGCDISRAEQVFNNASPNLDRWNQELEKLKNIVIASMPSTTLYNVLFMKRNEMARSSANGMLKKLLEECSGDFETRYEYFGSVLNVQYCRGLQRRNWLNSAKTSLAEIIGKGIPDDPGEFILRYLNNFELKSFGNIKWEDQFKK